MFLILEGDMPHYVTLRGTPIQLSEAEQNNYEDLISHARKAIADCLRQNESAQRHELHCAIPSQDAILPCKLLRWATVLEEENQVHDGRNILLEEALSRLEEEGIVRREVKDNDQFTFRLDTDVDLEDDNARDHDAQPDAVAPRDVEDTGLVDSATATATTALRTGTVLTTDGTKITLRSDSEFSRLLPPQRAEELSLLAANILKDRTCLEPLVIWKEQAILIDGHNRLPLFQKHVIPIAMREIELADRHAAKNWIILHQLGRRNLSPKRASYLRGLLYEAQKQPHGGDRRSEQSSAQSEHLKAAAAVAEKSAVSQATVRRDGKFARSVNAICTNVGENIKVVLLDGRRLSKKDVAEIAAMKPEEQREAIEKKLENAKRPKKGSKGKTKGPKGSADVITIPAEPKAGATVLVEKIGLERAAEFHVALGELLEADTETKTMCARTKKPGKPKLARK
jgi:hypothetical protein